MTARKDAATGRLAIPHSSEDEPVVGSDAAIQGLALPMGAGLRAYARNCAPPTIRRPTPQEFVRTQHPEKATRFAVLDCAGVGYFVVAPSMMAALEGEKVVESLLVLTMSRSSGPFFWPVAVPGTRGGLAEVWATSRMEAVLEATEHWVRVQASKTQSGYSLKVANGPLPEPSWPEYGPTLNQISPEQIIRDDSHPVVRRLRGTL